MLVANFMTSSGASLQTGTLRLPRHGCTAAMSRQRPRQGRWAVRVRCPSERAATSVASDLRLMRQLAMIVCKLCRQGPHYLPE